MSDSALIKVVVLRVCRSADLGDWHVEGVARVAYRLSDCAKRRVDLNLGRDDGFNRNVHIIYGNIHGSCSPQFVVGRRAWFDGSCGGDGCVYVRPMWAKPAGRRRP